MLHDKKTTVKQSWTGQTIELVGNRRLMIRFPGHEHVHIHIPELAEINVVGELIVTGVCPQCDAVPNLNRRASFHPWGIPEAIVPGSLKMYYLDADGQRRELVEGCDYVLTWPELSHIKFLNQAVFEQQKCYLDYKLKYQRVDVIAVNSDSDVKLFCGRESLTTPRWPMLPDGWDGIARVYSRFNDELDERSIYAIANYSHARLINFEPRTDQAARMPSERIVELGKEHPEAAQIFTRKLDYDRYFDFTEASTSALRGRIERQDKFKIVFFGDSITQGGDVDPDCRFTKLTADYLREVYPHTEFEFVNAAIGGTNSNFGKERFEQDVRVHKPDAVTIMFVLNDNGRPDDEIMANHLYFVEELRKINAVPIFITPNLNTASWMGRLDHAVERIQQFCIREDAIYVDVYSIWKDLGNYAIPYETLLANGINHPDSIAAGIFFEGLKRLFSPHRE